MPTVKACTKCGEEKPLDEFYKDKSKRDGRRSDCKECVKERQRRYCEENPEKDLERHRRYYEENREKIIKQNRQWREENREKTLEQKRRYREKNREKYLEQKRRYYEKNREEIRERDRRNREENREVINAKISLHMATTREVSKSLSSVQPYTPWSEQEDALLIADNGMTTYQKATQLGRTYDSCVHRRKKLKNLRSTTNV